MTAADQMIDFWKNKANFYQKALLDIVEIYSTEYYIEGREGYALYRIGQIANKALEER